MRTCIRALWSLVTVLLFAVACAPKLQVRSVQPSPPIDGQAFTIEVMLDNLGDTPVRGTMTASVAGEALTPTTSSTVDVAAGQQLTVRFLAIGIPRGNHTLQLAVIDSSGKVLLSAEHPLEVDAATRLARYNEVFQIASHNSYWVQRDNVVEPNANGVQQRLLDQLTFEHVRSLEIDLHKGAPGDWEVYHNEPVEKFTTNSFCARLEDCLRHLELFQYALPRHDVVTVVLELKDFDSPNFDANHTIGQLDALLERRLGQYLYRPRDLLARCPRGVPTLRDCLRAARWPTLLDLRGKFIFVVAGSWRDKAEHTFNYYGQAAIGWVQYATGDGGVSERAAFPMASDFAQIHESDAGFGANASEAFVTVQTGFLGAACKASVFLQLEGALDTPGPCGSNTDFLRDGGVVRRGGPDHEAADPLEQGKRAALGLQLLQTDHPWHVFDDRGPLQPLRVLPGAGFPVGTTLVEPGARILFTSTSPVAQTRVFTFQTAADGEWSSLVTATRPATDTGHPNPHHPHGMGCLRAQTGAGAPTDNRADHLAVCRYTISGSVLGGPGENVRITVESAQGGVWDARVFDASANASNGVSELLRLKLEGNCATAYSASEAPGGTPAWQQLHRRCFSAPLTRQGLTADTGDVLFVGTRHEHAGRTAAVRPGALSAPVLLGQFGDTLLPVPGTAAYQIDDLTPFVERSAPIL